MDLVTYSDDIILHCIDPDKSSVEVSKQVGSDLVHGLCKTRDENRETARHFITIFSRVQPWEHPVGLPLALGFNPRRSCTEALFSSKNF